MAVATANAAPDDVASSGWRLRRERDRLLITMTVAVAVAGTVATVVAWMLSDSFAPAELRAAILYATAAGVLVTVAAVFDAPVVAVISAFANAAGIIVAAIPPIDPAAAVGIGICAAMTAPASAAVLVARRFGMVAVTLSSSVLLFATVIAALLGADLFIVVAGALGWSACLMTGLGVGLAMEQTAERLQDVEAAYEAEHAASVIVTRKRQDARLLHDTVLATLSLVAHGGRGVNPEALRRQAELDALMLRNLRLTGVADHSMAPFTQPNTGEFELGLTLESVRKRFEGLGLDVNWHGSGRLSLPRERLDALVGAMGECLENVRRHAGIGEADVTVTDDDEMIRAMVVDGGAGFDPQSVAAGRLGLAESVVGRLEGVGGRVRVFSAPGAGTTVMLEVPK